MMETLRKHHISFKNAFSGLRWALVTQPNFRIHIAISILVVFLAYYLNITETEKVILVFTIVLGFAGEMVNTALESMTDLITTEWRKEAKIAKDVSAGMMLLIAMGATLVGCLIFIPYILPFIYR
jgi:diacylglycerol kinase